MDSEPSSCMIQIPTLSRCNALSVSKHKSFQHSLPCHVVLHTACLCTSRAFMRPLLLTSACIPQTKYLPKQNTLDFLSLYHILARALSLALFQSPLALSFSITMTATTPLCIAAGHPEHMGAHGGFAHYIHNLCPFLSPPGDVLSNDQQGETKRWGFS